MGKNNGQGNSWTVRIMALLVACALWLYVMNEQNPFTTRTFSVPLTKENLASDMVVHGYWLEYVYRWYFYKCLFAALAFYWYYGLWYGDWDDRTYFIWNIDCFLLLLR